MFIFQHNQRKRKKNNIRTENMWIEWQKYFLIGGSFLFFKFLLLLSNNIIVINKCEKWIIVSAKSMSQTEP